MNDENQTAEAEAEERKLNDFGEDFIAGRSRANAQRALDAADAVGMPQTRVRAVRDGYFAPPEIVDKYAELLQAEEEKLAEERAAEEAAEAERLAAEAEAAKDPESTDDDNGDDSGEPNSVESTGAGGEPVTVETAEAKDGDQPAEVTPAGTEGVEIPEGDPNSKWTVPQIDAWAAKQNPPILFEEGAVKADKLRAIDRAANKEQE